MKQNSWLALNDTTLSSFLKQDSEVLDDLSEELRNGIDTSAHKITAFKVEQKIMNMTNSNSLNVGGFANGSSNIKRFKTRYLVVMFSNKFKTITDSEGNIIKKRYGYGFGFTLDVSDINTDINFNYGILAASSALNFTKIGYDLNVYGVEDAVLAQHMPARSGDFSANVYKDLIKFITEAKKHMVAQNINKLYPIEVLREVRTKLESIDARSIYFGVKNVADGLTLRDAIRSARKLKIIKVNENVIQFIYKYFELTNAYVPPNESQKQNARRWISGKYNKIAQLGSTNDSWVSIDPAVEDGKFVALTGLPDAGVYQPHAVPANWHEMGKQLDDAFSEVSLDFSSAFKLSSIVDTSGKFNTVTITRNIALYTDISDNPAPGSKVVETRYGVGIRLILRISKIEFGTEVNYATIGAVSEIGHANVEFEISGLGVSDASMLAELPGPQDINEDTMGSINDAFTAIKNKLSGMEISNLIPQPYMIRVNEPDKIDPTLQAQAFVYSMSQIADRTRLRDAIEEGIELGIDKKLIKKTYEEEFSITDENDKPSFSHKREARRWLSLEDEE